MFPNATIGPAQKTKKRNKFEGPIVAFSNTTIGPGKKKKKLLLNFKISHYLSFSREVIWYQMIPCQLY